MESPYGSLNWLIDPGPSTFPAVQAVAEHAAPLAPDPATLVTANVDKTSFCMQWQF
jgi:hypothetical protein